MRNTIDFNWYLHVWKNYGDFEGRASRREYWNFVLFNTLISTVLGLVSAGTLAALYVLAVIIPSSAVLVRRLHDVGKSGWYFWIVLIPAVGAIVLLVWLCLDSSANGSKYGGSAPYRPFW